MVNAVIRRGRPVSRRGWALVDVVVGGVILGIGLATVVSIAERSLAMQQRSERELVAGQLLDGLLSEVLSVGVVEWDLTRAPTGSFDAPFEQWEWELRIDKQGTGDPYKVLATARDRDGVEFSVETLIAPRPENTVEPQRAPTTPIDRQARYADVP